MCQVDHTAALTGAEVTRDQQPHLPSLLKKSVRDLGGLRSRKPLSMCMPAKVTAQPRTRRFMQRLSAIESRCPVIFQPSTGSNLAQC